MAQSISSEAGMSDPNENHNGTTEDAFHDGAFKVLQPKSSGHRAGLDSLLVGAALPPNAKGIVADLGAGVGVVGLAALNLNSGLQLVQVEIDPDVVDLARKSLELAGNESFASRTRIVEADVTLSGVKRVEAGLESESVDHVVLNPPYNYASERPSPDPERAAAHMLGNCGLDPWLRTAAAITRPGGTIALIYRTKNIADVMASCQGRFGGLEVLPVYSKPDEAAQRIVVRGVRGSRAPFSILPGLLVHKADGTFTKQADKIFKGKEYLQFSSAKS